MQLSPHFQRSEFERDGCVMPNEDVVNAYTRLCVDILEPLREAFNEPFIITSGYRDAMTNARVGGVGDSQHIATVDHCAVDGYFESYHAHGEVPFRWLAMSSGLTWDQLILEHGKHGDILHISWSKTPRREALEGATFNQSAYTSRYVAPLPIKIIT